MLVEVKGRIMAYGSAGHSDHGFAKGTTYAFIEIIRQLSNRDIRIDILSGKKNIETFCMRFLTYICC